MSTNRLQDLGHAQRDRMAYIELRLWFWRKRFSTSFQGALMRQEWYNPQNERRYLAELFEDLLGDWATLKLSAERDRRVNNES